MTGNVKLSQSSATAGGGCGTGSDRWIIASAGGFAAPSYTTRWDTTITFAIFLIGKSVLQLHDQKLQFAR